MKQEKSNDEILNEFEAAIGKEFVFTGEMRKYNNTWAGTIQAVDRENMMIISEKGDYSINCIKLKEEQPSSLKAFAERKNNYSQSSLF